MLKRMIISLSVLIIGISIYYLFNEQILIKNNLFLSIIRNYLSDGLWIISFFFATVNFSKNITKKYLILTSFYVFVLGIIFEVFQLLKFVGGTFDLLDIIVYAVSTLIACLIEKRMEEKENEKI